MILPLATASPQAPVIITEGRMLHLSGLTPEHKAAIRKMLTIPNARRANSKKWSGVTDWSLPATLTGYEELPGDEILIAPGAGLSVWHYLNSSGCKIQYKKPTVTATHPDDFVEYRGQSRDYQDPVVETLATRQNAVAVGPCGCGKTDMALRVMARRQCPWLIVVHMRKLSKQWKERIAQRMWGRIGRTVSTYSPGRKVKWDPDSPFVIATVQALIQHPEDIEALAGEGRAIWVDECHHTPCSTFVKVVGGGAWRYRYGVTATPKRTDGTEALLHWWVGPIAATVEREKVEDSGHLLRPRLEVITTKYVDTYNPDEPGDGARLMNRLCFDGARAELICAIISGLWWHKRHILVCVDRIAYGQDLALMLAARMQIPAECCNGKMSESEQDRVMDSVAAGELRVVIATSLADEGLDVAILDTVVLATPSGSATRTEQRMGRACRPLEGKLEPLVVDIVDPLVQREEFNPETGETKIHRKFLNQFRSRYNSVYRKMATCDDSAVQAVLKGYPRHVPSPRESGAQ